MASENDFANLYGQAYAAYGQGSYGEAAQYINQMAEAFPDDPNVLLLQGHIEVGLERYDAAQEKYSRVLQLSDRSDLIECAEQALAQIQELAPTPFSTNPGAGGEMDFDQWQAEEADWEQNLEGLDWDSAVFNDDDLGEPTLGQERPLATENPFTPVSQGGELSSGVPNGSLDWAASSEIDWNPDVFAEDEFSGDDEKTLLPEMGASTFVVPGTAPPFELEGGGDKPGGVPTFQPWLEETEEADSQRSLAPDMPTVQSSPNSPQSQSLRANFPASFETFGGDDLDNLEDFDLTDIAPELPDSSLFTQTGSDLSVGADSGLGGDLEDDSSPTVAATSPPVW
jgi:twitching motility protein PilJ